MYPQTKNITTMNEIYANYIVKIDGKAVAYVETEEEANARADKFYKKGYMPQIFYSPKCRLLWS